MTIDFPEVDILLVTMSMCEVANNPKAEIWIFDNVSIFIFVTVDD